MLDTEPKIVLIGGGTGLSTILKGLKKYPCHITAIVSVGDDGGSSGQIRDAINIVPPGDIRKVIVAMSEAEPLVNDLLNYRFNDNSIFAQHTVGNIMLTALFQLSGDYVKAIEQLCNVLNVHGKVLPVAKTPITLIAKMEDGSEIRGEHHITQAKKKIKHIRAEQTNIETTQDVLDAIMEADLIVFGPGSLFTSIIPNLLVPAVRKAILHSKAQKLYICNVMTEPGETDGYTVSKHVQELEKYLKKGIIDVVFANDDFNVPEDILARYHQSGSDLVKVDLERLALMNKEVITSRFLTINEEGFIRHKSNKIAAYVVMKLIDEIE